MRLAIKKVIGIILLGLFLFGLYGVYTMQFEKHLYYKDLNTVLKKTATQKYLDHRIIFSINNDKYDDAVMYQHLAEYLGVRLSQNTLDKIEDHSGFLAASWRNTKDFGVGFFTGESESMVGMSGAIASDMTLVGDVRDLSIEGSKFANNEPYDKVILGMSAIGVGLSASQLLSVGATTPLKISASMVKVAKKMKYLSGSFVNIISSKLSKSIDLKTLKKVDFTSISSVKKASKQIAKSLNSPYIRKAFKNIDTIKSNTSISDTISLLKYVDDPKDLQKVANVSKKYKSNTKAVFKVLGKGVIKGIVKGSAKIIKWTKMLVAQLLSLLVSLLSILLLIRKMAVWLVEVVLRWLRNTWILLIIIWKRILYFIWKIVYNWIKNF